MQFNSLLFACFLALVLAVQAIPASWRARKVQLLVASYLFYAAWIPPFVLLLLFSTLVDWRVAAALAKQEEPRARRAWLLLSLACNLGPLAVFKYGDFALGSGQWLSDALGLGLKFPVLDLILPVGISFYTFQSLSYTIDVYRGRLERAQSFVDFALYVSFFPQLVAGPIVRASDFLPQCQEETRPNRDQVGWGLTLIVIGLFAKIVLADALLAPVTDLVFSRTGQLGALSAWAGVLAFTGQILCDFSGYSHVAIGVALLLGFELPDNFRAPYAARGFSDFWQRWHISLSSWLRDYLYISLGGNRSGLAKTCRNLMITMLLGGLWHGASWNFVIWGALHGAYLLIERLLKAKLGGAEWTRLPTVRALIPALTFLGVVVAWVFFRAETLPKAVRMLRHLVGGGVDLLDLSAFQYASAFGVTGALLLFHRYLRDRSLEETWSRLPRWVQPLILTACLVSIALAPGSDNAFIYFQF